MPEKCPRNEILEPCCQAQSAVFFGIIGGLAIIFEICLVCYLSRNCRRKDKDKETKEDEERKIFYDYFDKNSLTVRPSQIDIGPDRLGVGQFAEVRKGTISLYRESDAMHSYRPRLKNIRVENVAIKITFAGKGAEIKLLEEAMRLHTIRHDYIIELKGVCIRSANGPLMVMNLLQGNLESYLEKVRNEMLPTVSLFDAVRILLQVARAMNHLQSHDIVHRDLATRNILMTNINDITKTSIRLADFGLARIITHEADTYKVHDCFLPVALVPPEVFKTDEFCLKSDVWGFAVLAWEFLMVGLPPNNGKSAEQIRDCVLSSFDAVRCLPQPAACPDLLYAILKMCWALDPNERPGFSEPENAGNSNLDTPPAIISFLGILLDMLKRLPESETVYLSPSLKEEADVLFPLPPGGARGRPSEGGDSGYGDSANTSRHSDQFDSNLSESIFGEKSPIEKNYLLTKRKLRQISSIYEMPKSMHQNDVKYEPLSSCGSEKPHVIPKYEPLSSWTLDETQHEKPPYYPAPYPPSLHRETSFSNSEGTRTPRRYENWYYAQEGARMPSEGAQISREEIFNVSKTFANLHKSGSPKVIQRTKLRSTVRDDAV